MPIAAINVYLGRIPGLKAERKLEAFEAYATLWMNKGDKQKTLSIWSGAAFGKTEVRKATKGELAMIGIGSGKGK